MKTRRNLDRRAWRGAGLLSILLFAGCAGGLLSKPQALPTRYTLDAGAAAAPTSTSRDADAGAPAIVVAWPAAAPGFDSAHMVYLRRPQALEAFAFNEWVDTPARMLAPLIVRALQGSGSFLVVVQAPSAATGGYRLETEIVRLQQDFTARPSHVRLTLRAVLVDTATRQALAWREIDDSAPASTDDPAGGAAAALVVTQRVLGSLAAFVIREVGHHRADRMAVPAR